MDVKYLIYYCYSPFDSFLHTVFEDEQMAIKYVNKIQEKYKWFGIILNHVVMKKLVI